MALKVTSATARKLVRRDLAELAPRVKAAVLAAIEECTSLGYPVKVYECLRTHELAKMYYVLGVSKAKDGWKTWHFYGLAVDIIHPEADKDWEWWDSKNPDAVEWRDNVVRVFKKHGMDWGGDWQSFKDWPHFQWGKCKATPSPAARELYENGGFAAVWKAVGAQ